MTDFILLSLAVAGVAVLWRNLQESWTGLRNGLSKLPRFLGKSLTCGSCFTYWLSLAAVIVFDPLNNWIPLSRFQISEQAGFYASVVLSWFALAMVSIFIRFLYVAIQELVNYQTHVLRKDFHVH